MIVRPKWFRLTEETNSLDYLRTAVHFLAQVESDRWSWKWAIIAMHGALYGFSICACRGTDDESVVVTSKKGRTSLISLNQAIDLCADPTRMSMLTHSRHLEVTPSQKASVKLLSETLRNEFMHFQPKGWSIEIHGLPGMALDVLGLIRFLALETGTFVHLTARQRREVKSLCQRGSRAMKRNPLLREVEAALADNYRFTGAAAFRRQRR